MKIVYMGTPDFSVGALEALIKAGHEVTAVVTQPDKQKGRDRKVRFSPVKECALRHGLPVLQPVKIRTPEGVGQLRQYEADIFVVAAFGQILSKEILEMPKYGCVNIHASLLPKYRGAAPIQYAILNGEEFTGVTIMQMDEGVDTGDILAQRKVPIEKDETGESLFHKLSAAGAELLMETLPRIEAGSITPVKQDEREASHVRMLTKEMGRIHWEKDAVTIERLIRGMNSWPSAYCSFHGKTLKIWKAEVSETPGNVEEDSRAGEILFITKDSIHVRTGRGILKLKEIQPEGKKRMSVHDYLLGYPVQAGDIFL